MFALAGFDIQQKRPKLLLNVGFAAIGLAASQICQCVGAVHDHFLTPPQNQSTTLTSVDPAAFWDLHAAFDFDPTFFVERIARGLGDL